MNKNKDFNNDEINLRDELLRYVSFWPFLLILLIFFISTAFIYLRYASFQYETTTAIEILDESQDREMALPTELTVFNRSMINLENEINVLNSYLLHSNVVKELNSNIFFYAVGNIKTSQKHKDEWFNNFMLEMKIDSDTVKIPLDFEILVDDGDLKINELNQRGELLSSNIFKGLSTLSNNHNLPFELTIDSIVDFSKRNLRITSVDQAAKLYKSIFTTLPLGDDSDQLIIKIISENKKVSEEYLSGVLSAFDNDGIIDRQLEYKRTIEFVNEREVILKKELEIIELKKQKFKQLNKLSDLNLDAGNNIELKLTYNSELFNTESQKSLALYLLESISENKYDYLPINIGLEDFDLNQIIIQYNTIITERNKYLTEAGPNNILVKSLNSQLDNLIANISSSIKNYLNSIDLKIDKLSKKELEFENVYSTVPENEKILRSIERELTIKEALYLLLLQKREEAAINLAVVKPTIKIIEYPLSDDNPVTPKPNSIYLAAFSASIFIYVIFLYLWFFIDNKIHNKEQLLKKLDSDIPIICEIPHIRDEENLNLFQKTSSDSRNILAESIRMLISNLKFTSPNFNDPNISKTVIFTSSIKGEGKTLASVNTALSLANDLKKDKKVILVGADLRNPQVHKTFQVEKDKKGISEIIYNNDIANYKKYLNKFENLDVLFSGSIPPNPTSLLSGKSFEKLFFILKNDYDFVIIDSAPCLLVSDTFQIINYVDSVVYMFRSNFTDSNIIEYINELYNDNKIKNLNIVLNGVGNSAKDGYKYGYQYGYKYGYNYGYGYGYGSDSKKT